MKKFFQVCLFTYIFLGPAHLSADLGEFKKTTVTPNIPTQEVSKKRFQRMESRDGDFMSEKKIHRSVVSSKGNVIAIGSAESMTFGSGLSGQGAGAVIILRGGSDKPFKTEQVIEPPKGSSYSFGYFVHLVDEKTLVVANSRQGHGSGFSDRSRFFVQVFFYQDRGNGFVLTGRQTIDDDDTMNVRHANSYKDHVVLFCPRYSGGTNVSQGRAHVFNVRTNAYTQMIDPPLSGIKELDFYQGFGKKPGFFGRFVDSAASMEILFGQSSLTNGKDLYIGMPNLRTRDASDTRNTYGNHIGGVAKYTWVKGKLKLQAVHIPKPNRKDQRVGRVMQFSDGVLWSFTTDGRIVGLVQEGERLVQKHEYTNGEIPKASLVYTVNAETQKNYIIKEGKFYSLKVTTDGVATNELHGVVRYVEQFITPTDFGALYYQKNKYGEFELSIIDERSQARNDTTHQQNIFKAYKPPKWYKHTVRGKTYWSRNP